MALLASIVPGAAFAKPAIYVVQTGHESYLFTNRAPTDGKKAELFTLQHGRFSFIVRNRGNRISRRHLLQSTLYHDIIEKQAARNGIDPNLVKAVIHAESAFDPYARSPKGAMGLMQLMPTTAHEVGVYRPYEPAENIRGGVAYLSQLLQRYRGDVRLSLAAYNAGAGAVDAHGGIPPFQETRDYVQRVLQLVGSYRARSR